MIGVARHDSRARADQLGDLAVVALGEDDAAAAELFGEGVAVGAHNTWYAGSVADGRIASGDLRQGTSDVFVSTPLVPAATGLKADQRHNLLWVSGAGTGMAAVYNLATGEPVVALTLT